ncbi:toxin C-terminal domain-containing protein [Pseudomonas sp. GCM10022186]|uniref:toxin C-terminal domain-containing protein n=1 Tax=Pseudomonas sp. GCM10022186 TaxID=3252650 RepID=UPI00360E84D1
MVGGDENLELMSSQLVGLLAAAAVDGDLEKGSEIAKYATAYNQQVHREARERLEYGLEILHAQGKYPGLDAETVLKDLRKIVDGDASSASDLNPEVVKFLNSEFTPASLRDTLLEPEPWEILASIALDLAPTPVGKVSAAQKIKGISKEVQQALEQKYGADLLLAAKGAVYRTNKEAKIAAEALGFSKVSETVHGGQAVYKKGGLYITRDLDGHNGGAWKMADSIKGLNSKRTRLGTYDVNLKRIGD